MKFTGSDMGVPQGGIISPLLSNLVLHELDQFVENKISTRKQENDGSKPYKQNPVYHQINRRIHTIGSRRHAIANNKIFNGLP
jgi:retron-type reverse transcriptase